MSRPLIMQPDIPDTQDLQKPGREQRETVAAVNMGGGTGGTDRQLTILGYIPSASLSRGGHGY